MDLEIDAGRQAFACGSDSFSERSTLLVFADPDMPQLAMLDELSLGSRIVVGDSPAAFSKAAPDATVIFNWSGSCALLREVFLACPNLRWVHSRSAGLRALALRRAHRRPCIAHKRQWCLQCILRGICSLGDPIFCQGSAANDSESDERDLGSF